MNAHMCVAHAGSGGYEVWLWGGKCDGGDRETTFDDLWKLEVEEVGRAAGGGGAGPSGEWRVEAQRCEGLSAETDVWYDTGQWMCVKEAGERCCVGTGGSGVRAKRGSLDSQNF